MNPKFKREFGLKNPAEAGYFAYRPLLSVTMGIVVKKPLAFNLVANVEAKELELTAEKQFGDKFTMALGLKLKNQPLDKVVDAIKQTSCQRFGDGLRDALMTSLQGQFSPKFPLTWRLDMELSKTPIYIKLAGAWQDLKFTCAGEEFILETEIDGGCGFGLSKAGWIEIAKRVGKESLKTFMSKALPLHTQLRTWVVETALAEVAAGLAVAAAIVGFEALGAYSIGSAHTKGELLGLATWYSTAYCKKLFHPGQMTVEGWVRKENAQLVQDLVQCAWKDVVNDAKKNLKRHGQFSDTISENEILKRYRMALIEAEGTADAAEAKMQTKMRDRAYELLLKKKQSK